MKPTNQDPLQIALQRAEQERRRRAAEQQLTGKPVQISRNGYWRVPPKQRPKGWEKMGLKEPPYRRKEKTHHAFVADHHLQRSLGELTPMTEDLEARISIALTTHGGPPEIAAQLVAIAQQKGTTRILEHWIAFHVGEEWSALQFGQWCDKYQKTVEGLNAR